MFPTGHAVEQYKKRVVAVATAEAFQRLVTVAATAHRRPMPRWWTPASSASGLRSLYPASMPGVCLLARDGAILAVFEPSECQTWRCCDRYRYGRHLSRGSRYHRPSPGSRMEAA